MKKVNVALIGLGTIGRGVYRALLKNKLFFRRKYDVDVTVVKVCDKNARLRKKYNIPPRIFTSRYQDIVKNKDIDVVIELIGGIHPAKEIILNSLKAGKSVITANKALLAQDLLSILKTASKNRAQIRFEASVCGGIPIIKSLSEGLAVNRIESIFGIINGTSNYILSKMTEQECSFSDALLEAKKKGFAESNSSLDIKGYDSAHKLAILTYLAFGKFVSQDNIYVRGIEEISPLDVKFAKELDLRIKLLAIAKRIDRYMLEVRVHPTMIPKDHPLASVSDVFNAVYIRGELVEDQLFFGKGAGQKPTTSAVVSDLIDLFGRAKTFKHGEPVSIKKLKKIDGIQSKYYIRFMVIDRPGALAKISGILARHKISIASVTQKERRRARVVPVIMLTHEAREKDIKKALDRINSLGMVKRRSVIIHREDL